MKLAITNLVFPDKVHANFLKLVRDGGVSGVEVAPTKIADWGSLTFKLLNEYKSKLHDSNLEVSSLQSLFYGLDDCQLIGSKQQFDNMLIQFHKIIDIANALDTKICLFGSPKSRLKLIQDNDAIEQILISRMGKVAEIFSAAGKTLVVESIPNDYGGQILVDYKSALSLIRSINSPGLKMHLDIGCVSLAGDEISQAIIDCGIDLHHYQASELNIGAFTAPKFPHEAASKALLEIGYDGWVSIEMIGVIARNEIVSAIKYVRNAYKNKED